MRKTATKRVPGRGSELTLAERREIAVMKAGGSSNSAISRKLRRPRKTVIAALRHPDVEEMRQRARDRLTAALCQFSDDWVVASAQGARRGRHEAARDALLHLGAIEPLSKETPGSGVQILVGVALPGTPQYNDGEFITVDVPGLLPESEGGQ